MNRFATLAVAIVLVAIGIALYVHSSDNYAACKSTIGGIIRALDPASARDCADAKTQYVGSIVLIVVGGLAFVAAVIPGRKLG
ncbi:MAG TPA: hypothetical protein VII69_11705 [Candidatus Eremiobacteraceae bacterium]